MKAIFLDRDGVINDNSEHYYIYKLEQWTFNPGIEKVLKHFCNLGYELFIVSNQGGISRGICTKEEVETLHSKIFEILGSKGIKIRDIAICPHHNLLENCLCRKPKSLMLEKLIAKHNIDIEKSWFVGDSKTDFEAANAINLKSIIVPANTNIFEYIGQIK